MTEPQPVREGGRWRHAKPTSEEVADWFNTIPLDEGMSHDDFISGVVVIPASEKVKKQNERGMQELWEQTFTPYVRVDTRIAYFRKLAAKDGLVAVIEPVTVPTIEEGDAANGNMPPGFWWHIVQTDTGRVRYLCCTMRVALYKEESWLAADEEVYRPGGPDEAHIIKPMRPVREGVATKQVPGGTDINGLAKAETGAVGRALGMAGILVVGTGVATAEDMQEHREAVSEAPAALPAAGAVADEAQVNEQLLSLQAQLRPHEAKWGEFAAWWTERAREGGWKAVSEAPLEVRRGVIAKMEAMLAEIDEQPQPDSSPAEEPSTTSEEPS